MNTLLFLLGTSVQSLLVVITPSFNRFEIKRPLDLSVWSCFFPARCLLGFQFHPIDACTLDLADRNGGS